MHNLVRLDDFRILILCPDVQSGPQYGPNIRAIAMARELAREFPVTLGIKRPADASAAAEPPRPHGLSTEWWDRASVGALLKRHSIVVSLGMQYPARLIASSDIIQIFDLYDPVVLEHLAAADAADSGNHDNASLGHLQALTRLLLLCGDHFLCASPQQRDLWLGGLYAAGRLARSGCGDSLTGDRALLSMVPFGHDGAPPPPAPRPVLKGVNPNIAPTDKLLLWGGGVWNWSDPLTLIRATASLSRRRPDIKLFFMASLHAGGDAVGGEMLRRAVDLARELGVLGTHIFFNETWTPFDRRAAYLQESDLAVCTTPEGMENHFSFRTRLIDALWCGLPVVCTRDGFLADYVDRHALGFTVAGGDAAELESRIELALDPEAQNTFRSNLAARRDDFRWDRCLEPLAALCRRVQSGQFRPRRDAQWKRKLRYARYKLDSLLNAD